MKIHTVFDPEFSAYGKVVTGLDEALQQILPILEAVPSGEGVQYVAAYPPLQELPAMALLRDHCFGGMPAQLGVCNGFNTRLNCLEYHRDSEFNVAPQDIILLVAREDEIQNGVLDTARVKAFRVPAGVLVEVYATTLHYAPCHCDPNRGFQMLVALPLGTNTEKPAIAAATPEDRLLWAKNKWLLAHPDSEEAKQGAYIGLTGTNIDIAEVCFSN